MVMFWDGWEKKGRCTSGSGGLGHKAFGYKFLLQTLGGTAHYSSWPKFYTEFDAHGDEDGASFCEGPNVDSQHHETSCLYRKYHPSSNSLYYGFWFNGQSYYVTPGYGGSQV
jgi:hypothetical protein